MSNKIQQMPSTLSITYSACKKTLSTPSHAITLSFIALASYFSQSFRYGLIRFPIVTLISLLPFALKKCRLGKKVISSIPHIPSVKYLNSLGKKINNYILKKLNFNDIDSPDFVYHSKVLDFNIILPIIEACVFRGIIQSALVPIVGSIPGVFLTAFLFSVGHDIKSGSNERAGLTLLNTFIAGIALGIIKEKVSIFAALAVHIGHNSFPVTIIGYNRDINEFGFIYNFGHIRCMKREELRQSLSSQ